MKFIMLMLVANLAQFSHANTSSATVDISTWIDCINRVPSLHIPECQDSVSKGKIYHFKSDGSEPTSYELNSFERGSNIEPQPQQKNKESGILGVVLILVLIVIGGGLYFLPSIVAASRSHKNTDGISILNLFLGWTLVGWVASLVWAVSGSSSEDDDTHKADNQSCMNEVHSEKHGSASSDLATEIEKLAKLHKDGILTDQEFSDTKKKLLGI